MFFSTNTEHLLTAVLAGIMLNYFHERFCVSFTIFLQSKHNYDPHFSDEEIERQQIKKSPRQVREKLGIEHSLNRPRTQSSSQTAPYPSRAHQTPWPSKNKHNPCCPLPCYQLSLCLRCSHGGPDSLLHVEAAFREQAWAMETWAKHKVPQWSLSCRKVTNYNQAHFLRLPKKGKFGIFPYVFTLLYNYSTSPPPPCRCSLLCCPASTPCGAFNKLLSLLSWVNSFTAHTSLVLTWLEYPYLSHMAYPLSPRESTPLWEAGGGGCLGTCISKFKVPWIHKLPKS